MTFTRDERDADLKATSKVLESLDAAKFTTLAGRIWKRVMSAYMAELIENDDPWVKANTLAAAPTTGAAVVNTTIGDIYSMDLVAGAASIADDTIFITQGSGTLKPCPRADIDTIVTSGTSATTLAFDEVKGKLLIYSKEAEFTAPATVHYNYNRILDGAPAAGATVLDIKFEDYDRLLTSARTGMLEDLGIS